MSQIRTLFLFPLYRCFCRYFSNSIAISGIILCAGLTVVTSPAVAAELPSSSPARMGLSAERLARIDSVLEQYVADGRIVGAATYIVRRGSVVHNRAFGYRDREAGDSMQVDSIFRIASQTKAIVSVGLMMLQEQGKLLIGDPVGKYLPEYMSTTVMQENAQGDYEVVPAQRRITIRDLLTHTAGINYGAGPAAAQWQAAQIQGWYFGHREEPIRETVRRIAELPFAAQPGSRFVYGYNTDILGALIEVVSGEALDTYLAKNIFEPLDMVDTHFYLPPGKRDRLAVVYAVAADGTVTRSPDVSAMLGQGAYVDGPRQSFSGGAGLLSTPRDYARFLQMMLNSGVLDDQRILSRNTVKLMTADHLRDIEFQAGVGFGLGFSVSKDVGARGVSGSIGEFAWGGAYHTTYWVDPLEELVVVYMTQLIPAGSLDDNAKLRALIYQAIE